MLRISWAPIARDRVATAWEVANPALRESIMDGVDAIERLLADDPRNAGESRELGARILIVPPLSVSFRLNVRLQQVYIFSASVFTSGK